MPGTLAVVVDRHPVPAKFDLDSGGLGINRICDNVACDAVNRITHARHLFGDLLHQSEADTTANPHASRFVRFDISSFRFDYTVAGTDRFG